MNLEVQKKHFEHHIAKFTDYGNIKILDFQKPDSSVYRIRFLFEEDYYRLHISGDLGELIASNYHNMCWDEFDDYVHNPGYFEEKIDTHSRPIYVYDEEKARKDLIERLKGVSFIPTFDFETEEELRDETIDDILSDFDDRRGIGSKGYDALSKYDSDCWEYISEIGKEKTGIIELYLLAFDLAKKKLEEDGC